MEEKSSPDRLERIIVAYPEKKKVAVILEANLKRDNDLIKKRETYSGILEDCGGRKEAERIVKLMKKREKENLAFLNSYEESKNTIMEEYIPVLEQTKKALEEYKKIEKAFEELNRRDTIYGILLQKETENSLILPIKEEELGGIGSIANDVFALIEYIESETGSPRRTDFAEGKTNDYLTLIFQNYDDTVKEIMEKSRERVNEKLRNVNLQLRIYITEDKEEISELSKLLKTEKIPIHRRKVAREIKTKQRLPAISMQKIAEAVGISEELLKEMQKKGPLTKGNITDLAIITKEYGIKFPEVKEFLSKDYSLDKISALYIVREYYFLTYNEYIPLNSIIDFCEEFNGGEVDESLIIQLDMLHELCTSDSISERIEKAIELKNELDISLEHICDIMEGKEDRLIGEDLEE